MISLHIKQEKSRQIFQDECVYTDRIMLFILRNHEIFYTNLRGFMQKPSQICIKNLYFLYSKELTPKLSNSR